METPHFTKAVAFGINLVKTLDLDPVYIALAEAGLPEGQLLRTLLAYSCLYHLGAAAYLGEYKGRGYWDMLYAAARNNKEPRWPRGAERRHWRGGTSLNSVLYLMAEYPRPEDVFISWRGETFNDVASKVQLAYGFGPWIAFKVADLMDCVLRWKVDFSDCTLGIYRDPRQGAALLVTGDKKAPITDEQLGAVVRQLLASPFGKLQAPPWKDRRVNVQEAETVLCKYKSHVNGHYPPGKDLREVHHALTARAWGRTANRMAEVLAPLARRVH